MGLGRTFGGEAESRFVTFHPDECQVLDDGRRVAARVPQQPRLSQLLQRVGRLGARLRRRLRLLGRACVARPRSRRHRRPGAVDVPLRPLRRPVRRAGARRAVAGGAGLPRVLGRRLPPRRASRTPPAGWAEHRLSAAGDGGLAPASPTGTTSRNSRASRRSRPIRTKHWGEAAGPFVRRYARLLRETCERHGVAAQLWLPSFGLTAGEIPGSSRRSPRRARRESRISGRGATRRAAT